MAAPVPVPASQQSDAVAAPFVLSDASRLVADAAASATAALASTALATATGGRPLAIVDAPARSTDIVLQVAGTGQPQSYTLAADADGVRIAGADEAGLFYGVQTLVQLLHASDAGWTVTATRIDDHPRFAYRGVMLDVARHFFPVAVVEALIDHATTLKLNALHLHLSDDQGWRLQLTSRPALTERAAGSAVGGDDGGFYTKADYARIVAYAAARHITVVPEVDGPGHTHAVGLAYPQLVEPPAISAAVRDTVRDAGGDLPADGVPYTGFAVGFSSLRIHDEATYEFLADVYGELAGMTPGPYLHVGGDEAHGTDPNDFAEYMVRVTALVHDLGKTPVAWHEAGAVPDISDDTVGQYWGFVTPVQGMDEKARAFVRNGAQLILSPADAVYLDMKYDASRTLGLTWANGATSVERSYRWDPLDVVHGLEPGDVLGVEAPLWTETIRTAADIDAQAFPRLASAAEIAWSPRTAPERTWASFRTRVGSLAPLWRRQGIGFFPSPEIDWATEGAQ